MGRTPMGVKMNKAIQGAAALVLAMGGVALPAEAANVTWANPTNDTGNASDVGTTGTLFAARTTGATTALNGVTFISGFNTLIRLSGVEGISSQFSNPTFANSSYNSLVGTGAFSQSNNAFSMAIEGLTVGNRYSLQLFTPFWDANWATAFTGGTATSGLVNLTGPNRGAGASNVPQNIFGTFVADASTQTIRLSSSTQYVLVAAAQVRDITVSSAVPEPATWAMMTLGFGAMGLAMRRKKVATRIRFA